MAYNFDDFVSDAANVFDKLGERVTEAFEFSKSQFDKAAVRSKIREKYAELGKLYYDSLELGADKSKDIRPIIEQIIELKKQLAQAEGDDNAQKDKTCAFCETVSGADCVYCPKCGEKL